MGCVPSKNKKKTTVNIGVPEKQNIEKKDDKFKPSQEEFTNKSCSFNNELLLRTATPNFKKESNKSQDEERINSREFFPLEPSKQFDNEQSTTKTNFNNLPAKKSILFKEPTFSRNITEQQQMVHSRNPYDSNEAEESKNRDNSDFDNSKFLNSEKSENFEKNIKFEDPIIILETNEKKNLENNNNLNYNIDNSSKKIKKIGSNNIKDSSPQNSSKRSSIKEVKSTVKTMNTESDSHKSLEKIQEETNSNSNANLELKNSIRLSLNGKIFPNLPPPSQIKPLSSPSHLEFRTNLIDLYRTESPKNFLLPKNSKKSEKIVSSKMIRVNPNANLITIFKSDLDSQRGGNNSPFSSNVGEDDNHNLVTIDGPSPINRRFELINDREIDKETSLNISTLERITSDSNIDKLKNLNTPRNDDNSKSFSKISELRMEQSPIYDNMNNNFLYALESPNKNSALLHKKQVNKGVLFEENLTVNGNLSNQMNDKLKSKSMTLNEQENIQPHLKNERLLEEIKENLNEKNNEKSFVSNVSHSRIKKSKTASENSVIHTSIAEKNKDESGRKKINQYTLIKELGRGGFAKVKLAFNENEQQYYAIKIANKKKMKRKLLTRTTSVYTLLEKEIATMKKLNHPHIVRLFEVIDDENAEKLYLVMEFMQKGAILSKNYFEQEKIDNNGHLGFNEAIQEYEGKKVLPLEKARKYFREFLLGLDYLHRHANVIHRDLKPDNLLIDENDVLKIADFGVSSIMDNGDDRLSTNAGTKAFLAPETWDGKPFQGKCADIWACVMTLYYLVIGKLPFITGTQEELKRRIQKDDLPECPAHFPSSLIELFKKGLEKNPAKRITLPDLMSHKWVTNDGQEYLENYLEEEYFEVSEKEIKNALTKIQFRAAVGVVNMIGKKLKKTRTKIIEKKSNNASFIGKPDLEA